MATTLTNSRSRADVVRPTALRPGITLPRPARGVSARSTPAPDPTPAATPPSVRSSDDRFDLVAIGTSLHSFTEAVRDRTDLGRTDLHRATAVLTKQVASLLGGEGCLPAIRALVTDPARVALADGRTAAALCGEAWPAVRSIADERAHAAIEGAAAFGESAILRLAATRAAAPTCAWWGTRGWTDLVDRWASDHRHDDGSIELLLRSPETADDEMLVAILDR